MHITALIVLLTITAGLVNDQKEKELKWPDTWKMILDRPEGNASKTWFVVMTPGWHLTTGPAAIFYDPARQARRLYRLESTIFLFPEGRSEGFGVFVGGTDLDKDICAYLAFLIRRDGQFKIQSRSGVDLQELVPWTPNSAIVKQDGTKGKSVKNILSVEAGASEVVFLVNGEKMHSLARYGLKLDGIVGLRVNDDVNIHVRDLTVQEGGAR